MWLSRLALLGLVAWVLFLLQAVFWLALAQGAISVERLEGLTTRERVPGKQTPGSAVQNYTWEYVVPKDNPQKTAVVTVMPAASLALGFVLALLLVVACHHWRRWAYLVPVVCTGVVAGLIVGWMWFQIAAELRGWGARQIAEQTVAYLLGGAMGVWQGRAAARLVVVLLLPPRLVQLLAFLWRADGKALPHSIRDA